jgi:predicted dehydrogenase
MTEKTRVGVIGCGAICAQYFKMARLFPILEMAACADLEPDRARARADEFGIPRALSVEQLLADPEVDVVLNLTVPRAHASINVAAIEHGKHVFCEKPLGIDRGEGRRTLEAARAKGVRVGCAPDTFLGAGLQTARKVIDDGDIGRPVAFTAFFMGGGHEAWHANPEFFYEPGGGPMLDMGPYYVTALLNLLGPVRRITGSSQIAIPERIITSQPKAGKKIRVETDDLICGTMEFENGAAGTIITSFATKHPVHDRAFPITVWGTEGTLRVPDPNTFDGAVQVRGAADEDWREVPHAFLKGYGRAVGLADMAHALRSRRPHRASGEQAYAALDLMLGFTDASRSGRAFEPEGQCERPAPMSAHLPFGVLDD